MINELGQASDPQDREHAVHEGDDPPKRDAPKLGDFDALALPQNFDQLLPARKVLTAVPLRKPFKHEWIRTHPTWEQQACVLKLSGDRRDELWLLRNDLAPAFPSDLLTGMFFVPTITRQGTVAMWPLRAPRADGRVDTWASSAITIARVARTRWIQLHANQSVGAFEYQEVPDMTDEPEWPDITWDQLRELAFRNQLITSLDHPVVNLVLRGK
jgi:hypothetical protein